MEEPSQSEPSVQEAQVAKEGQEPDREAEADGKKPEPKYSESYVRGLRREAAEERKTRAELETELQELRDRDKTESERIADRLTAAERRAEEAELNLLRFEIASKNNLGLKAANFLGGTTREEIEASADELVKLLAEQSKSAPAGSFDGGARTTPAQRETPEVEHNKLVLKALGR